jgi:hypothetical protein
MFCEVLNALRRRAADEGETSAKGISPFSFMTTSKIIRRYLTNEESTATELGIKALKDGANNQTPSQKRSFCNKLPQRVALRGISFVTMATD